MSLETFIIGVSGHTGSGKNVIGDIAKALGHYCFDMGDVVRVIEPANRGIPKESMTKELEKQIRNELREKYGQDAIALVASEHIKGRQASVVFVTDIVSDAEISRFKKEFGNDLEIKVLFPTEKEMVKRDKDRECWTTGIDRILTVHSEFEAVKDVLGKDNFIDTTGQTPDDTLRKYFSERKEQL